VSDSYCKGCHDATDGCERCRPARDELERRQKRADAERAVLRIVRRCCKDSRTWMQANIPALFAADEALARREAEK
jgi:hypothetical protein